MRQLLSFVMVFVPAIAFGKVHVVATIPDYAQLAEIVGGEYVSAHALVKGTQDPHYVDAKPSMIVKVNRADLLILNGMELEIGWLPVLLKQARNEKIQKGSAGYLDASSSVSPLEVPILPDRVMGDVHAAGNPHFYSAPDQLLHVAHAIYKQLVEIDPAHKKEYQENWQHFNESFSARMKDWKQRINKIQNKNIVVYHLSWVYFLNWAGFHRVATLEPKPGVAPSVRHISSIFKQIKNQSIHSLWQEVYHPTNLSSLFAHKAKIPLLILPSMIGASSHVKTVEQKFEFIVSALEKKE